MTKNKMKFVVMLFFVAFLFLGFLRNNSAGELQLVLESLSDNAQVSFETLEEDFANALWKKKDYLEINGTGARILKMNGYYSDMGLYVTDDRYILSASPWTSTDYEVEQTVALRDALEESGIKFLYVNKPTKYVDDSTLEDAFGVETYSNRNMDRFLSRLEKEDVPYLDLRDCLREEGIPIESIFYRTDHHWTVPAALWATQKIAQALNEKCDYHVDTTIFDPSKYETTEWKACWLGEQGRKLALSYVGLDDYTEMKPAFPTSYSFKQADGSFIDGTFDSFIADSFYNTEEDVYEAISWHFSYQTINCINQNVDAGKVLFLGDSYDQVTEPFLSLGVHEIDFLCNRYLDEGTNLAQYAADNGYDTVIVAYAQFMVGAHDDKSNSNYRMFTFQ